MIRRRFLLGVLCAALALPMAATAAVAKKKPTPKSQRERVVIQVSDSDPKHWNLVLTVAKSLQREYGDDKILVEIVAFGPGVNMLKSDSEVANRVNNAIGRDILVTAGAASMKVHNIDEDDLVKYVIVVPSGAAHILRRQRQGWLYLKP